MCSINSSVGDIDGNTARITSMCREAASEEVDLICFPELSIPGYSMPRSRELVTPEDGGAVGAIIDLSGELGMAVCFGYMDAEGHIAQGIAEDGRFIGKYCKTHPGEREVDIITRGDGFPVMQTKHANVAIQICWEAHFPEISTMYGLDGADLILMPFASGLGGERRQSSWDRVLPARAYDNTVFVGACNAYGPNGYGVTLGGGASIYNVRGERMACETGGCQVTADLDPEQMDRIRAEGYESMRDVYFLDKRRPDLYHRICRDIRI